MTTWEGGRYVFVNYTAFGLAFRTFSLDPSVLSASWEFERHDMDMQAGITKLLENFTKELLKLFSAGLIETVEQVVSTALPGATAAQAPRRRGRPPKDASRAAPSPRPSKPKKVASKAAKSSPAEVSRLGERIVSVLQKATHNLSVSELVERLKVDSADRGRFDYALGKLKDAKEVIQHGERGQARYSVGKGNASPKRGPGRPKKSSLSKSPEPAAPSQDEAAGSATAE
jgi:hypothetical protein